MKCLSAAVGDFRTERKCFYISGSLMLMLLLLVTQAKGLDVNKAEQQHASALVDDDLAKLPISDAKSMTLSNQRMRRNTDAHSVHKRNAYLQYGSVTNSLPYMLKHFDMPAQSQQPVYVKHAVPGKLWNALNIHTYVLEENPIENPVDFAARFGGAAETDRVIWGGGKSKTKKPPARRVTQPTRAPPPLFHDSNPNNIDLSFMTKKPETTTFKPTQTTKSPTKAPSNEALVSDCIWAIVNCCSSRNQNIRYNCFERFRCTGAFWNINPCADNIVNEAVEYVAQIYN